jgi:adenylate cyclase
MPIGSAMGPLPDRPASSRIALRALFVNPATLTAATIAAVSGLFFLDPPLLHAIESNWFDLRFQARGPVAPQPTVVLAAIDEKSIAAEGRWPWPRSRMAELVDALSDDGAKVIGFDITFSEPDENSQLALVDRLQRTVDVLDIRNAKLADFIRESRLQADTDQALAKALKRSQAPIVLGYFFHMDQGAAGKWLARQEVERLQVAIEGSKYPVVLLRDERSAAAPLLRAHAPQGNLELFAKAAPSSGYFTIRSDPDGVIRSMPLVIQGGEDLYPPLALLCAWHYLGKPQLAVRIGRSGVEGIQLGDRFVPTDESGQMLINYRGPPNMFPHFSVSDILAGRLKRGTFKDRIVLVGVTALGVYDIRATPFSPVFPGLEIHANAIDNLLVGDVMSRPQWSRAFDVLAIVALGVLISVALPRMSAVGALALTAVSFGAYVAFAHWLFVGTRVWLNIVYPLLALVGTYTVLTVYRYITEERERRKVKEAFRHYVSTEVIDDMLADPSHLRLGGDEKVLTVLFNDIVGFSTVSEQFPPSGVIAILSDYYTRMTEQVLANRGTLTNYIGDELMAIFGAPVAYADHARCACAAALAMRDQRAQLAAEFAKVGRPALRARTGINTGTMLVGNVGSAYRFAYTVLGDQVNLTSRLEQLNRTYGTEIMIGETTASLVADAFVLRELDRVKVKGRAQALRIFELVGRREASLPHDQERMLRIYAAALEAYRQRRWEEAAKSFRQCQALWPDDGPSRLMEERCRGYLTVPPSETWDGAFAHQSK